MRSPCGGRRLRHPKGRNAVEDPALCRVVSKAPLAAPLRISRRGVLRGRQSAMACDPAGLRDRLQGQMRSASVSCRQSDKGNGARLMSQALASVRMRAAARDCTGSLRMEMPQARGSVRGSTTIQFGRAETEPIAFDADWASRFRLTMTSARVAGVGRHAIAAVSRGRDRNPHGPRRRFFTGGSVAPAVSLER